MENSIITKYTNEIKKTVSGRKILFATVPFDGHVNPLTGLAVHLKSLGYDVRWYTSTYYADKMQKLGIPFYPLVKAMDVRADEVDVLFPERKKHKSQVAKLNYDIINVFINRATEYFADVVEIHKTFPFDVMISDITFTATPFVIDIMKKPVITGGIVPLTETSKDLAPSGLGITPSSSVPGKIKQAALRFFAIKSFLKSL